LRTLLIHGARSVLIHNKEPSEWVRGLVGRRPMNVAVVAIANKLARTLWALLAHGRTYQRGYEGQPGVKTVAVKTEAQQAVLAMHRMRQRLVKFRTAQSNALRGLLTEYGEVMPQGRHAIFKAAPEVFARLRHHPNSGDQVSGSAVAFHPP
jgi:transposase